MTGLLISVRDRDEAETVLSACPNLDILDIKEPAAGALGAATPQIWREIGALTLNDTSLSIALGDLNEVPLNQLANLPVNAGYAKVGLANQQGILWIEEWRAIRVLIPEPTELVGVIYADHRAGNAPSPVEIIQQLSPEGCKTFLIDTYEKNGAHLLDYLTYDQFQTLKSLAPDAAFVIAGSLNEDTIPQAQEFQAEFIGVRGAICEGRRDGGVSAARSRQIINLVKNS